MKVSEGWTVCLLLNHSHVFPFLFFTQTSALYISVSTLAKISRRPSSVWACPETRDFRSYTTTYYVIHAPRFNSWCSAWKRLDWCILLFYKCVAAVTSLCLAVNFKHVYWKNRMVYCSWHQSSNIIAWSSISDTTPQLYAISKISGKPTSP